MHESVEFLSSLDHTNPHRPKFRIIPGPDDLEITFKGQVMVVPIAEVLDFANRWDADHEAKRPAAIAKGHLFLHPYPLYNVRLQDPDVPAWD